MSKELVSIKLDPEKIEQVLTPETVTRLDLRPDDILVISVEGRISQEAAERLKLVVGEKGGIPNKILVVEDCMKFGVIRKTA